ncbi:hypothetical protein U9M48_011560 [Paspalum notatum var. saurae]|uniref:Protein kinase domain-containing protein n=1 Tax=Paspalum notatum var. saurae TaxID=547442 RepID=A0AAQ3SW31_PASNO
MRISSWPAYWPRSPRQRSPPSVSRVFFPGGGWASGAVLFADDEHPPGYGLRMQSLLRNVCRAGSRGAAARLLEVAAPVATHPGATQPPAAIKHLSPYGFSRPIWGQIISLDGAPATPGFCAKVLMTTKCLSTVGNAEVASDEDDSSTPAVEHPPRIKFKRPDKTARHIMNILNKEAVDKVRSEREIPDVQPGCIIQMRLQVPENKRRESTLKGIVIGRRNAGINTTFRLRRLVAGVGVESVFPLYSPNIKEIKILDRKKMSSTLDDRTMAPPPLPVLMDELVGEILLRVPPDEPKHLFRAALVCKPWLRILCDRVFLGAPPLLGYFSAIRFTSTTSLPDFPHTRSRTLPIDSRHGRVLLYVVQDNKSPDYLVWDPVTGDRHAMPEPDAYCLLENAAVLCAAHGCAHLDCHGGPFRVVLVASYSYEDALFASVYSSKTGAWSAPVSLDSSSESYVRRLADRPSGSIPYLQPRRGALFGDEIYFTVWRGNAIVGYDLAENCLSMIDPPVRNVYHFTLMKMEDCSLGFACIRGSSLYTWSRKVNSGGGAEWVQWRVMDLETMIPVANLSGKAEADVVGFAEGLGVIFVSTAVGLFTVKLSSGKVKKINKHGVYFSAVPYMSFYTPDCCRWRGISDACPTATSSGRSSAASRPTSPSTSSAPRSSARRGSAPSATGPSSAATAPSTEPHLSSASSPRNQDAAPTNASSPPRRCPTPPTRSPSTPASACAPSTAATAASSSGCRGAPTRDPVTGDSRSMPKPYIDRMFCNAAVFCAADGCDHLDCHGGPFQLVDASVYSSVTGAWSAPVSLNPGCSSTVGAARPAVVGDEIYFLLQPGKEIVRYSLRGDCLSVIDPPPHDGYYIALMAMVEDSSLGFACTEGSSLFVWSRKVHSPGAEEWVRCRVIELESVIPVASPRDKPLVVGSAEGVGIIFVRTGAGLFACKLNSGVVKMIDESRKYNSVLPYMNFYTPKDLAEELHEEILLRLPADPVVLFRASAVSRQWSGLMSTTRFRSRFFHHHDYQAPPVQSFVVNTRVRDCLRGDFFSARFVPGDPYHHLRAEHRGRLAVDVRHGRVLLVDAPSRQNLQIWEPLTGALGGPVPLPVPPPRFWGAAVACAIPACDHINCDGGAFRVVFLDLDAHQHAFRVHEYDSASGSWSDSAYGPASPPHGFETGPPVLIGDVVFFLINEAVTSRAYILQYNGLDGDFSIIQLPQGGVAAISPPVMPLVHLPPTFESDLVLLTLTADGGLGLAAFAAESISFWAMGMGAGDGLWSEIGTVDVRDLSEVDSAASIDLDPTSVMNCGMTFAFGTGITLLGTWDSWFSIEMKTGAIKKLDHNNDEGWPEQVLLFLSLYTPGVHKAWAKGNGGLKRELSVLNDANCNAISAQSFALCQLASATENFRDDFFIGEGRFGRVYRGRLDSTGQVVAIRQLNRDWNQGDNEFLVDVLKLSLLHHENLVNLVGYCADGGQRLLVYEYMALGSLEGHLHDLPPNKEPLDWNTRMKIAAGAAKGLECLHDKAQPPVIYREFKSSNILLGEAFHPKLSDFGLATLAPAGDKSHISTHVMVTNGYCAPEYAMTGQPTAQSDVYSFGVVLLELISGRRAIDNDRPAAEQYLVPWSRSLLKDVRRLPEIADSRLEGRFPMRGLYQALALASLCIKSEAASGRKSPTSWPLFPALRTRFTTAQAALATGHRTKTRPSPPREHQGPGDQGPALMDDLVGEILLRLPPDEPEHLFRAALVCKPWLRILCDPSFRRRYSVFHGAPPLLSLLHMRQVMEGDPPARFASTTSMPDFPHPGSDGRRTRPLDCRHGRVLIHMLRDEDQRQRVHYLVWDPITGDRHAVPSPNIEYLIYSAAVFCAVDGCDHLDCHGSPFRVVFVATLENRDNICACVYSSETAAWSTPVCLDEDSQSYVQHMREGLVEDRSDYTPYLQPRRGTLIGDAVYFTIRYGNTIIKYDWRENSLSMIDLPSRDAYNIALMATQNGSLGFACIQDSSLYTWSREVNSEGAAEWVQCRVIELETAKTQNGSLGFSCIQDSNLYTWSREVNSEGAAVWVQCRMNELETVMSVTNPSHEPHKPFVVGFAEGVDVIFVSTSAGLFTVKLNSAGQVKKIDEPGVYFSVLPYMSFYTPDRGRLMSLLMDDLVGEILLRLPPDEPEHLFRAALVCKLWLRILCNPSFRRRYSVFHGAPPLLGILHKHQVVEGDPPARFASTTSMPDFPHPGSDGRRTRPLDCRHGRVLIHMLEDESVDYLIWDPITGDCHAVPEPDIPWLIYSAAVFCAVDRCDHLDCHGGPFRVVFAATHDYKDNIFASAYSSETGAWNAPASLDTSSESYVQRMREGRAVPSRGTLLRDAVYFTLRFGNTIIKYDWSKNSLSMIDPPSRDVYNIALMATENSSLGFACIQGSSLYNRSREVNSHGAAEWVQCRVIDLETVMPFTNTIHKPFVVGFAEGVDAIFVSTGAGLFTVKLSSRQVKKIDEPGVYFSVLP